jgi:branched-subunit amino acid permease
MTDELAHAVASTICAALAGAVNMHLLAVLQLLAKKKGISGLSVSSKSTAGARQCCAAMYAICSLLLPPTWRSTSFSWLHSRFLFSSSC